ADAAVRRRVLEREDVDPLAPVGDEAAEGAQRALDPLGEELAVARQVHGVELRGEVDEGLEVRGADRAQDQHRVPGGVAVVAGSCRRAIRASSSAGRRARSSLQSRATTGDWTPLLRTATARCAAAVAILEGRMGGAREAMGMTARARARAVQGRVRQ